MRNRWTVKNERQGGLRTKLLETERNIAITFATQFVCLNFSNGKLYLNVLSPYTRPILLRVSLELVTALCVQ